MNSNFDVLELDALLACLVLGQTDPCDLRLRVRAPGHDAVVDAEAAEGAEERVHGREPRHVRRDVRELIRTDDVAAGIDGRDRGLQVVVDFEGAVRVLAHAEIVEAERIGDGLAADGDEHPVEGDFHFAVRALRNEHAPVTLLAHRGGTVVVQHGHAVGIEGGLHDGRRVGVLARQQARCGVDHRHLGAEAREGLSQLGADRTGTEHDETLGHLLEFPDGVGGEGVDLVDAGNLGNRRRTAGRDDDVPRRAPLAVHLDGPGIDDARLAEHHVHAEER